MNYKILYIEDGDATSAISAFREEGLVVEHNDASSFDALYDHLKKEESYDAYILDFRLTSFDGKVDAPTYASMLRSAQIPEGDKSRLFLKAAPIILISTQDNLPYFDKDFTSQDLFDLVSLKPEDKTQYVKLSQRIKTLVDAYQKIEKSQYEVNSILGLDDNNIIEIDYHLAEILEECKNKKEIYGYCRTIYQTIIRSSGLLIGEDMLAARLGVDKEQSGEAWKSLKQHFVSSKYKGIFSSAYNRWWMCNVLAEWNRLFQNTKLRRLTAEERVAKLNSHFGFTSNKELVAATPIQGNESTCFWTICAITGKPLDPSEGYLYEKIERKLWEERDYASLHALLENTQNQKYISPISKRELQSYV